MHFRAAISLLYQVKSYALCVETNLLWENKVKRIAEIQMRVMKFTIWRKYTEQDQQDISECSQCVAISPLKIHVQPLSGRVNFGKRKLNTTISTIQEKVARALRTPKEINLDATFTEDVDLLQIKAETSDRLMQPTKEKFSTTKTHREIIQGLSSRNLVNQKSSKFLKCYRVCCSQR